MPSVLLGSGSLALSAHKPLPAASAYSQKASIPLQTILSGILPTNSFPSVSIPNHCHPLTSFSSLKFHLQDLALFFA